jgi:SSS family solute:Na+ symporter
VGADIGNGTPGDPFTIAPRLFDQMFPDWVAGTAFATIVIGAFVPAAVMSIAAANLFSRNVYTEFLRPAASPREQTRVSQIVSVCIKFIAAATVLILGIQFSVDTGAIVGLQTLPAVGIGLFTRWPHRLALAVGLIAGVGTAFAMLYQIPAPGASGVVKAHFGGTSWPLAHAGLDTTASVYVGLAALLVNLAVVVVLTPLLRLAHAPEGPDVTSRRSYDADEGDAELRRLDEILDGRPVRGPWTEPGLPRLTTHYPRHAMRRR